MRYTNNRGVQGWISTMILGIIVMSACVTGLTFFQADILDSYTNDSVPDYSYLNKTEDMQEMMGDVKDQLDEKPTGIALIDGIWTLGKGAIAGVNVIKNSMSIFTSMITDIDTNVSIVPSWITTLLLVAFLTMFVLAIIAVLLKRWI